MYAVVEKRETQGLAEKYIDYWIKSSGKRNQIVLATKVTGPSDGLKYGSDLQLQFYKEIPNPAS